MPPAVTATVPAIAAVAGDEVGSGGGGRVLLAPQVLTPAAAVVAVTVLSHLAHAAPVVAIRAEKEH